MKKWLLMSALLVGFSTSLVFAQNAIIGTGFSSGWDETNETNWTFFGGGVGTSRILTVQSPETGNRFFRLVRGWSDNLAYRRTQFGPGTGNGNDIEYDSFGTIITPVVSNAGAYFINVISTEDRYVFKTPQGDGANENARFVVFRLQGVVQTLESHSSPNSNLPDQDATLAISTSGSTAGQGFYVRYSSDNFATSTIVEMTGSGTSYSVTIPASVNSTGSTIRYYFFSSGEGLTILPENSDLFTINLLNNGGSNYSYFVTNVTTVKEGVWSDPETWAAGEVPNESDDVIIAHNITLDQNTSVGSLTINAGSSFSADSFTLSISNGGSFANNGTFNAQTSTISFLGSGLVSGTASTSFYNISILGGVSLNSNSIINGTLTIRPGGYLAQTAGGTGLTESNQIPNYGINSTLRYTGGFVFGDQNFAGGWGTTQNKIPQNVIIAVAETEGAGSVIITGSTRTLLKSLTIEEGRTIVTNDLLNLTPGAYINPASAGTITGNITFQQSVAGAQGWRMLYPAAAGRTFNQVLGGLWTQGIPDAQFPSGGTPNVIRYNEVAGEYQAPASLNDAITAGQGFAVFVYEKDDGPSGSGTFPKTIGTTGSEGAAYTKELTVTEGRGWHMLGNPFSTPIRAGALGLEANADLNNNVYVWDHSLNGGLGEWATLDGTNDSEALIAPFQAFFVRASAVTEFSVSAAARQVGTVSLRRESAPAGVQLALQFSNSTSNFALAFNDKAELGVDPYDAFHLQSFNNRFVTLFGREGNHSLSRSVIPTENVDEYELPIYVNGTETGAAELSWTGNLPEGMEAVLVDMLTGNRHNLTVAGSLSFTVQPTHTAEGKIVPEFGSISPADEPRFKLMLNPPTVTSTETGMEVPNKLTLHQNYPNPFNPSTMIQFDLPVAGEVSLTVHDMLGRKVATLVNGGMNAGSHTVTWDASRMASGMYIYRLQANGTSMTRKMTLVK